MSLVSEIVVYSFKSKLYKNQQIKLINLIKKDKDELLC
jgi:hypothetical protein